MKIMNFIKPRIRYTALAFCAFAIGTNAMWSQSTQDAQPSSEQQDGTTPPSRPRMEQMEEHHIEMMTKHLSLTPDQVSRVRAIDRDGMTQILALRQDASTPQVDKREKMKTIHEDQTAKIRGILTDDQKSKFDTMLAHQHERMEHRHDGHNGKDPQDKPSQPLNPPPAT